MNCLRDRKNPIFVTGTTSQNTPWAMRNEAIKNSSLKSESNANLLGQKITLPGVSTDSPMLLEFDEKLDFLLGQNSTGEEVPGRSLNGEFIGWGNSSAEKNSPKVISGGENQPTQETFDVNGILGGPKPPTVVEETGTPQKPQLSKTEHVDLYQQVAEKVIWSIRNNEERIRLTLEPPQLGNLFIELHREKEEIKATLWADNPKTKEILENNQFQLQKTLEGHGFKLEKYDVFLQNDMASFQGKEEKPVFHGHGQSENPCKSRKRNWPRRWKSFPRPSLRPGEANTSIGLYNLKEERVWIRYQLLLPPLPKTRRPPAPQRNTTLTQQDFLQLFTKQLQYQDPLNPMDSTQMLAQMTQLNTVTALDTMTQSIQNMEAYQASASSLQAVGLIGKKVEAKGNTLSIDGQGKVSEGSYQLAKSGHVYIQIFDANGNTVRVIDDGVKDTSKQTFTWDGKNQQGAALPAGNYTFKRFGRG